MQKNGLPPIKHSDSPFQTVSDYSMSIIINTQGNIIDNIFGKVHIMK